MGRIAALDGLRAIAIAMVIAYHVDNSVVPAGHWGVPLFFALSGFVITGSICGYRIEEIQTPLTRQVRYLDKLVDEATPSHRPLISDQPSSISSSGSGQCIWYKSICSI